MDVEAREAVHAFELLEAVERHLARARDELQELRPLLLVEAADRAPEPLDLGRRGLVVVVFGVVFPVVDVDVGEAGDEELEFLFVEDGDQPGWNDVVEACVESVSEVVILGEAGH